MSRALAKPAPRLRCAIYTRKSSEEGLDQAFNSLHAQRESCEAYIASQAGEGWSVIPSLYDDGGFSGGSMERPGLRRLLADVEAGRIDVVVLYKIDRLTRSLTDFSRIVEVFDRSGASFVSVTQAFNTTTSMGRLTLNMLLSFAQFEREVTGERIRDKIAASKRKGLWMGGNIPLGYDPDGRTLKVNEAEGALVRHIFERYLALGSVEALRAELTSDGHLSKSWTTRQGTVRGGVAFSRGALFHLLSNRLYLGEIPHKDETYPGLHAAIVDAAAFAGVQEKLAVNAGADRRARIGLEPLAPAAPLAGLLRDDRGHPMSPVAARGKRGQLYRYYVSGAVQVGRAGEAGSLSRLPAPALEGLILDRVRRLLGEKPGEDPWPRAQTAIRAIEASRERIRVVFDREAFGRGGQDAERLALVLPSTDALEIEADAVVLTVQARLQTRGGSRMIATPDGAPVVEASHIDLVLLRALVRAEAWKRRLVRGGVKTIKEIADDEGLQAGHVQRILRLAFLSPDLKLAILNGRAPARLTLQRLMEQGVPDLWANQRAATYS